MRYAPYAGEVSAVGDMRDAQLLDYFLTRVFETEEVWGLDDGCEWLMADVDGRRVMQVWPYRQFAAAACAAGAAFTPAAESLEDFVYQTLGALMDEDAMLEIMPAQDRPGCLVSPHRLYAIFTGMFDTGDYRLDG